MKKTLKLWIIPAIFFVVCCILNLYGDLSSDELARCTKPALLPLLALTTLAALAEKSGWDKRKAAFLLTAQLFGFAGDTMLLGSANGFLFFAGGILLFLIGHVFYISLFGGISWKGMKPWQWAIGLAACVAVTACLLVVLKVSGTMFAPMAVYAFMLALLMFSALAGALRKGGALWWLLFVGTVTFTFSDSLIAVRTFTGLSEFMGGFMVMFTYLVAQSILAFVGYKLVSDKVE